MSENCRTFTILHMMMMGNGCRDFDYDHGAGDDADDDVDDVSGWL